MNNRSEKKKEKGKKIKWSKIKGAYYFITENQPKQYS